MDKAFRLGEAGRATFQVAERLIGVRSTEQELIDSLKRVLRAHLVTDVEAPGNLSFHVGVDSGNVRGFHFLYRGNVSVLRTRSRARMLRAAIAHLDGFDADPEGTLRLTARLLTDGHSALVIDAALGATVQRIEKRLELLGYKYLDTAGVAVDRTTLEVVTWPPRLQVDREALADVEREDDAAEHRAPAPTASRLPIRSLVLGRTMNDDGSASWLVVRLMHIVASAGQRSVSEDMVVARRLIDAGIVCSSFSDDQELMDVLRARVAS